MSSMCTIFTTFITDDIVALVTFEKWYSCIIFILCSLAIDTLYLKTVYTVDPFKHGLRASTLHPSGIGHISVDTPIGGLC